MPLPDEDFPLNNHDLGVPWQTVVARMDLVRVAVVVERLEVDRSDRCSAGDVLLGIGAFWHVGQYLLDLVLGRPFDAGIACRDFAATVHAFHGLRQRREADSGDAVGALDAEAPAYRARRGLEVLVTPQAPTALHVAVARIDHGVGTSASRAVHLDVVHVLLQMPLWQGQGTRCRRILLTCGPRLRANRRHPDGLEVTCRLQE
jgi:hypothetical protein